MTITWDSGVRLGSSRAHWKEESELYLMVMENHQDLETHELEIQGGVLMGRMQRVS